MKRVLGFIILSLTLLLSACGGGSLGGAVDVSGTWEGTMTYQGAEIPLWFDLDSSGSSISGTFDQSYDSGSFSLNGSVSGNRITITASAEGTGYSATFSFEGTVSGDSMTGSWDYTISAYGYEESIGGSFNLTRQ